jgi:hypothetical protein
MFPPEQQKLSALAWTDGRVAAAAFFVALLVYLSNTASTPPPDSDSVPNAYLAVSVLGDGDLAFSPFEAPFMFLWSAKGAEGHDVRVHVAGWTETPPGSKKSYAEHYQEGRLNFVGPLYFLVPTTRERPGTGEPLFVGAFGSAAGLTALPLYALARLGGMRLETNPAAIWLLAKVTAAALAAGSVALIYLSASGLTSRRRALMLAAAYAVGTCVWSISAQSLWQQTPEIFFLALGLFCLLRIPTPWIRGAAAGLALSAAAACRPTAAVVVAAAAVGLLLSDRRAFPAFLLAIVPAAAATLVYNAHYFGSPLDFGQIAAGARVAQFKTGSPDLWQTPLWLGAAGLLISPSRGLLVYSPFLAAAFAGAVLAWKDPRYRSLRYLTLAVPALWIPAFLWFDWWGGWTYGYRPIVDSVPLLAALCLPVLEWILARPVWRAAFAVSLAWSILVQGLGAFAYSPWGWNARVIDSDGNRANVDRAAYRSRLWSFRDWQIGYLIANFQQSRAERGNPIAY